MRIIALMLFFWSLMGSCSDTLRFQSFNYAFFFELKDTSTTTVIRSSRANIYMLDNDNTILVNDDTLRWRSGTWFMVAPKTKSKGFLIEINQDSLIVLQDSSAAPYSYYPELNILRIDDCKDVKCTWTIQNEQGEPLFGGFRNGLKEHININKAYIIVNKEGFWLDNQK